LGKRVRIFLAGDVTIFGGDRIYRQDRFPGLQGRVVFAMLAAEHTRAVSRDELEAELWGDAPPAASEPAIRALVSKVRAVLVDAGLGSDAIASAFGAYQLRLPPDTWVDLEASADAIHRAEPALREGDLARAVGFGRTAATITGRPLLTGAEGPWVTASRDRLRKIRLRAFDCLAEAWLLHGDAAQAARDAELAIGLDSLHEPSYRLLMRALARGGNRASALRTYERLRTTLVEELGVDPSRETEQVYVEILRSA
jgi:DNA-binding SARP family transcriptional activator